MSEKSRQILDFRHKGALANSLYVTSRIMETIKNTDGITFRQIVKHTPVANIVTIGNYLSQLVIFGLLERSEEIVNFESQIDGFKVGGLKPKFITHYHLTGRGAEFLVCVRQLLPSAD